MNYTAHAFANAGAMEHAHSNFARSFPRRVGCSAHQVGRLLEAVLVCKLSGAIYITPEVRYSRDMTLALLDMAGLAKAFPVTGSVAGLIKMDTGHGPCRLMFQRPHSLDLSNRLRGTRNMLVMIDHAIKGLADPKPLCDAICEHYAMTGGNPLIRKEAA